MKTKTLTTNFLLTALVFLFLQFTGLSLTAQSWTTSSESGLPARKGQTMVKLSDGRILTFGGEDSNADLYNDLHVFQEDQWKEIIAENEPPQPRKDHAAWVNNDKMYVYGGQGKDSLLNDLWSYDPEGNVWIEEVIQGIKPPPRYSMLDVYTDDGFLYISGGLDENENQLSDTYRIADGTNMSEEIMAAPHPVYGQGFYEHNSSLYVPDVFFGGTKMFSLNESSLMWETFDPPQVKPPFTTDAATIKKGEKIFKMGGYAYVSSRNKAGFVVTDQSWTFNCETHEWIQKNSLPFEVMNAAAIFDSAENTIKIYGGKRADGTINDSVLVGDLNAVFIDEEAKRYSGSYLKQNFPNPFTTGTTIAYYLSEPSNVKLLVCDLFGNVIDELINGRQPAGEHSIEYIPSMNHKTGGVWFYRLQTNNLIFTRKMVLNSN